MKIILAKNTQDAHAFAVNELGLNYGHGYRVVTSVASISGLYSGDLYLVPGWTERYDRFAMISHLRYTRLNKIDVAELRRQEALEQSAKSELIGTPDNLEPAGEQLALDGMPEDVSPYDEMIAHVSQETSEKPTRRRRCKECGILVEPDDVDKHAAEHLPFGG